MSQASRLSRAINSPLAFSDHKNSTRSARGRSEKFWMRPRADRSTGTFFGHPAPSFHKDQKVFWRCEDDEEHDNILEENPATDILTSHRLRCFFPRPRCYTAGSYVTSDHTSLEPVDTWNGHTTIKCICQIKAMLLLLNQSCCFRASSNMTSHHI